MRLEFDDKLTEVCEEIGFKMNLSNPEVVRRAVALLKIAVEGEDEGKHLYLIDAETRIGIDIR